MSATRMVLCALPVLLAIGSGVVAKRTASHHIVPLKKMASDPGFDPHFASSEPGPQRHGRLQPQRRDPSRTYWIIAPSLG